MQESLKCDCRPVLEGVLPPLLRLRVCFPRQLHLCSPAHCTSTLKLPQLATSLADPSSRPPCAPTPTRAQILAAARPGAARILFPASLPAPLCHSSVPLTSPLLLLGVVRPPAAACCRRVARRRQLHPLGAVSTVPAVSTVAVGCRTKGGKQDKRRVWVGSGQPGACCASADATAQTHCSAGPPSEACCQAGQRCFQPTAKPSSLVG